MRHESLRVVSIYGINSSPYLRWGQGACTPQNLFPLQNSKFTIASRNSVSMARPLCSLKNISSPPIQHLVWWRAYKFMACAVQILPRLRMYLDCIIRCNTNNLMAGLTQTLDLRWKMVWKKLIIIHQVKHFTIIQIQASHNNSFRLFQCWSFDTIQSGHLKLIFSWVDNNSFNSFKTYVNKICDGVTWNMKWVPIHKKKTKNFWNASKTAKRKLLLVGIINTQKIWFCLFFGTAISRLPSALSAMLCITKWRG